MDFTDQTVLVTGGSSGIGRSIARLVGEQGGDVVIADIRREPRDGGVPTDELVAQKGQSARYVETDVTDIEQVRSAVDEAVDLGGLDGLVNCAGWAESYRIDETEPENWSRSIDINLTGVYHGCRAGVEGMLADDGGSIVNIASVAGITGLLNSCSYSASKAGVVGLTRQLAVDYARDDIRVNSVSPGFVETMMLEEDTHEGTREFGEQKSPMNRLARPSEVAQAVVFLLSDWASFVTGQNLPVDGGYSVE